jgi:hypothetical protein
MRCWKGRGGNTVSSQKMRHRARSGGISTDHDVVWVSAEFLDVAVDPLEGFYLVFEAVVEAGDAGEETVGTDLGVVSTVYRRADG